APIVEQLVHRGAHRPPGVEHVVDYHDVAIVDVEGDLRGLHLAVQADRVEVVAVERYIERSERRREAELAMQSLGEPRAPGANAPRARGRRAPAAELAREIRAERLSVGKIHRGSSAK